MKIIRYQLCTLVHENETTREVLYSVEMPWSESNEQIAKEEAYRGEYTIEEVEEVSGTA